METWLPKLVDPARLATKRETLSGTIQADKISRLGTLYDIRSPVEVVLNFAGDGPGKVAINGNLGSVLEAQCQRCLHAVAVSVAHEFALKLVDTEYFGVKNTSKPLEASDDEVEYRGKLDLHELIEDELILASPIVPLHSPSECVAPDSEFNQENFTGADFVPSLDDKSHPGSHAQESPTAQGNTESDINETVKTTRPFEGLADLLSSEKKQTN